MRGLARAGVAAAIERPQDWLADLGAEFQSNRDLADDLLARLSSASFAAPEGGRPGAFQESMARIGNAIEHLRKTRPDSAIDRLFVAQVQAP